MSSVCLPKGWFAFKNNAVGRQIAFLEPPPPQGTPIEQVDVGASDNRDLLRLFPIENPESHPGGDSTCQDEACDVPAYCPSTHIYIVDDIRSVLLRGAGLADVAWDLAFVLAIAVVIAAAAAAVFAALETSARRTGMLSRF